ncbi:MAG: arginine--tRNA ligase [Acidobacteriota bacterium]|nr:arginine--tRNA ligase [Acidobacteriota bacterium]
MNLLELQKNLREKIIVIARNELNVELENVGSEIPPKTELGDVAFPIAFELSKKIKQTTGEKQNPREIAEKLKAALEENEAVESVKVAGAGYLNVFFNRANFLIESANAEPLPKLNASENKTSPKVCVEHTSVNPNKAAHIGHVRNSVLGDTFARILKATGKHVEVQNYIDNTGVQVADVVVGFIYLEKMSLEDIKNLDEKLIAENKTFDYYCWDLYAKVGQVYQTDEALKAKRPEVLHLIEAGNNPTAELADYVATRNVQCILATMERFGIRYDLLPRESEILHLHFWKKAFDEMQRREVIEFETTGKNAGCWVMPFEAHSGNDEHEADKILVRSNGTVTYTGKDIAYQMWKLGLLGMDFYYNLFHTYADGKEVWITSATDSNSENVPHFGSNETVYNVIDSRQSYPQEVVKQGVATIFPEKGEAVSVHLNYERVGLSPNAAQELGFVISDEDKQKSFVEMSGRKGLGVKADDLMERLETNALIEVNNREKLRLEKYPDDELLSEDKKIEIAHRIAVGGLRYFLLKFTRNTVIVFDFKEALALEGETGVFCQYSAVRANSIFRKLSEQDSGFRIQSLGLEKIAEIFNAEDGNDIWSMAILASRLDETIAQAANAVEPAILAKYAFNLAKSFNLFYHNHKIITEEDDTKRAVLIAVADLTRRNLTAALDCLGIEVPERM